MEAIVGNPRPVPRAILIVVTGPNFQRSLDLPRIFHFSAGLAASGPVRWGEPIPESGAGVYVLAVTENAEGTDCQMNRPSLPPEEAARWLDGQPIIYIGTTRRSIRRRLAEFWRHEYGKQAPHRGGEAVKLLAGPIWVYWAATRDPREAERQMIEAFRVAVGDLPFANRRR